MELDFKEIIKKKDEYEEKYFKAKTDSRKKYYNKLIDLYIELIIKGND